MGERRARLDGAPPEEVREDMQDANHRRVVAQFGERAEKYRDERLFAEGEDLAWLVEAAALQGRERVLDVGTGAGHTALALAPGAGSCTGIDLTEPMVRVAEGLARARGVENVTFAVGAAEQLPFPDGAFDLVVCRFAAHHFADFRQAVREMARVLAPGGRVLAIDHYAPENEAMDAFINEIDRTRDPSHVREWRLSEWEAAFAAAGLAFCVRRCWDLALDFANWVDRAGTPPEARAHLARRLAEAPPASRAEFRITLDEAGQPTSFCLKAALIEGRKGLA